MQAGGGNGGGKQRRTRRQTQVCGAGHRESGGGWRGVGVGDIQVDGIMCQERRWGAGINERCGDDNRYLWGSVGGRETKRYRKRLRQVGWGARIKLLII